MKKVVLSALALAFSLSLASIGSAEAKSHHMTQSQKKMKKIEKKERTMSNGKQI